MGDMEKFLRTAYDMFRIQGRNEYYIDVPARLSTGYLASNPGFSDSIPLVNPLIFLSAVWNTAWRRNITPFANQEVANVPSITLVVGEYGMGKTELMLQLCQYMLELPQGSVKPLPINLALLRPYRDVLNHEPSLEEFLELLFGRVLVEAQMSKEFALRELVSDIRNGQVLLILDGLDELVSDLSIAQSQHYHFLSGLNTLLHPPGHDEQQCRYKVVTSMRLEYLWLVANADASDMAARLLAHTANSVYFLQLGFLSNANIQDYIANRLPTIPRLYEDVTANPLLLDILSRPLYLKIFCDLVGQRSSVERAVLLDIKHPAELFDAFVHQTSSEYLFPGEDSPRYVWDIDKLSYKSLDIFQSGLERMSIDDVRSLLKPIDAGAFPPDQAWDVQIHYVHKCPFLQRVSEDEVRFAHRSFLEFFTARGIALALKNANPKPFDDVVANVDMRSFLKYFAEKVTGEQYNVITRRGNGMDDEGGWNLQDGLDFHEIKDELEFHRTQLLQSMITPEAPPEDIEDSIHWFLEMENKGLHLAYLMYNYEAIAVNIRYNWWKSEYEQIDKRFSVLLCRRMENLFEQFRQGSPTKASLLLVERIFDIARRLRYDWIKQFVDRFRKDSVLLRANDDEVRQVISRINILLQQIEYSSF